MTESDSIRNLIAFMGEKMRIAALIHSFIVILSLQMFISSHSFASTKGIKYWSSEIDKAIVQINTVSRDPYYAHPWVTLPEMKVNGTGFIIKGNRILTSAHVVANQIQVEVRKAADVRKYRAKVEFMSHEADLALLTVTDPRFFMYIKPLEIDPLPVADQNVTVYGFPEGETLVVSNGIFSGLDLHHYTHSSRNMLAGEILSYIKSGHSGGPVVFRGRVIGVIMQANRSGQIAHMVPGPVIHHFLADISDGRYDGFPALGLIAGHPEPEDALKECSTSGEQTGIAVHHVITGSPAEGLIRKGDILTSINGFPVYNDSMIELSPDTRTHFTYAVEMSQVGDVIEVGINRDNIMQTIFMTLDKTGDAFKLVSGKHYEREPTYFIYGGIIFSPLTINYLAESRNVPDELFAAISKWPTMDRKEVVVALEVLPAEVNRGYHRINKRVITDVNGRSFKDFYDFFQLVISADDPSIVFGSDFDFALIIINRLLAEESHEHILETYGISADRSADLQRLHASKDKSGEIFQ